MKFPLKTKSKNKIPPRIPLPEERIPVTSIILLSLAAIAFILLLIAKRNIVFADYFNTHISSVFRFLLAKITDLLPFSFAEFLIILSPVIVALLIIYAVKHKCGSWRSVLSYLVCLLSGASVVFTLFVFVYGIGYYVPTLDEKIGIEDKPVTAEELAETADKIIAPLNECAKKLQFDENGSSVMPYSLDEMNDKLMEAYKKVCAKYPFIQDLDSNVKPVLLSEAMSYTHFTGFYTFFTGECNINVDFPDYTLPYTTAHEFSHQRGIARENEANFVAFLVCLESDGNYIRYCGYINMYEYISSALYSADYTEDKTIYYGTRAKLCGEAKQEMSAYSAFYSKYEHSKASVVSTTLNDAFLKANGTEAGEKSYGLVVDLTVAYYKDKEG